MIWRFSILTSKEFEIILQIMEIPSLLEEGSTVVKRNILKQKQEHQEPPSGGCCS
jgi:Ras-related protein Rab-18